MKMTNKLEVTHMGTSWRSTMVEFNMATGAGVNVAVAMIGPESGPVRKALDDWARERHAIDNTPVKAQAEAAHVSMSDPVPPVGAADNPIETLTALLQACANYAMAMGLVATIELVSDQPPSMGKYRMVPNVRTKEY